MSQAIWKYQLLTTGFQFIEMPRGAQILCVQMQHDSPHIWAIVNPDEKKMRPRKINTYGTGQLMEGEILERYIGTYQLHSGALVFHVFEVIEE